MAVPTVAEITQEIHSLEIRLNEFMMNHLHKNKLRLDNIKNSYILKNPLSLYEVKEQKLDSMIDSLNNGITKRLDAYHVELNHIRASFILKDPMRLFKPYQEKLLFDEKTLYNSIKNVILKSDRDYKLLVNTLKLVNPLNILDKGYSLVKKGDEVIKSVSDLKVNDKINIRFSKGCVEAEVRGINDGMVGT